MNDERTLTKRRRDEPAPPAAPAATPSLAADLIASLVAPGGTVQATTGHLEGVDDEGRLLFRPEGEHGAPVPVSIGLELSDGALVKAARQQRRALVLRTADPTSRWMLVGLVRDRVAAKARDAGRGRLEVSIDGEKLTLNAEHDLELKCGRASITLRYDGRIELRGTHILSASRGPIRIKGATVALN